MGATDQPAEEARTCAPCRGSGRVISSLGGTPREVECPWCGGTGKFDPERDAQAHTPRAE